MPTQPGDRVGRLVILEQAPKLLDQTHKTKRWKVRCDCGTEKEVWQTSLRTIVSCGCVRREKARETMKVNRLSPSNQGNTKHGRAKTATWSIWCDMRKRCSNPNHKAFGRYGGRGIRVCEAWESFENFFRDMGERPTNCTLDRVDNDGDYEPGNCRWSTRQEQANNRSSNRYINAGGRILTVAGWARETGIHPETITSRIDRKAWTAEEALGLVSRA